MKNTQKNFGLGRTAVAVLLVATLTTAYAQGNGNQPSGQGGVQTTTNVVVTNSSGQPVPVTVMNQPASSSMTINNTPAQPVPTKDQNSAALQQPFVFDGVVNMPALTDFVNYTLPAVPAGKRLVIEQISGTLLVQNATGVIPRIQLSSFPGGKLTSTYVPMTYVGAGDTAGKSLYQVVQQVRMIADPGQAAVLFVSKSRDFNFQQAGVTIGDVYVTGYLIDVP